MGQSLRAESQVKSFSRVRTTVFELSLDIYLDAMVNIATSDHSAK